MDPSRTTMLDPSSILYESHKLDCPVWTISVQYTIYPELELCIAPVMVIDRNLGIQPKYEKFEKSRYFEKSYFPTFSGKIRENRCFEFEYENFEKFRKITSIFRAESFISSFVWTTLLVAKCIY